MKGLAGVLLLALVSVASAEPGETIVVASDDAAFRAALDDTLVSAGITVVAAEPTATPALSELAAASRELADRAGATATVWMIGTTLVTYDRGVDRVLVRALPFTAPLTAAQRAEAARMARTMLRALRITRDSDLPPPHAADAPATHAVAPPAPPVPRAAPVLGASIGVGMRAHGPTDDVALDGSVAAIWRPDALGAALAGSFAPSTDVMTASFAGSIRDDAVAVLARLPARWGRVGAIATAGAALHVITLHGTLASGSVSSTSLDPAVRVGAAGTYALDPTVDVGLGLTADYLVRRQRYDDGSIEILAVSRLAVTAGLTLMLRVW